jgi:hypothetical protein
MAFDLNRARRAAGADPTPPTPPAPDTLVADLAASVAINRPRMLGGVPVDAAGNLVQTERQATAGAAAVLQDIIDTTGVESVGLVVATEEPATSDISVAIQQQALAEATAPKARRTRRPRAGGAAPVSPTPTGVTADSVYQEAEAIATSVQTLIDRLNGVLGDLDKRIATLLALRGVGRDGWVVCVGAGRTISPDPAPEAVRMRGRV